MARYQGAGQKKKLSAIFRITSATPDPEILRLFQAFMEKDPPFKEVCYREFGLEGIRHRVILRAPHGTLDSELTDFRKWAQGMEIYLQTALPGAEIEMVVDFLP